jgi:uncharacterized glyoxalase superfamily protein PhnB
MSDTPSNGPDLVSGMQYQDAPAAIAFLESAFGFRPGLVVPGEGGSIVHAELWLGRGAVMLGSVKTADAPYVVPGDIGDANTGACYAAVADIDALYARAKGAGARIVAEPERTDYGSIDFSARDPEGYLWHFGTYHPSVADPAPREPEIFSGMRYERAGEMMAFLERAFGFERHFVVPGDGDTIAHAQLRLGSSLLMIGSARDDRYGMKLPREVGGKVTQSICVAIGDPDRRFATAVREGATALAEPYDTEYGSRSFSVRDPEGYVWHFGTYRAERPAAPALLLPYR